MASSLVIWCWWLLVSLLTGWQLHGRESLVQWCSWALLFGKQVVLAHETGLLIWWVDGGLGRRRVAVLFPRIKLRQREDGYRQPQRQKHCHLHFMTVSFAISASFCLIYISSWCTACCTSEFCDTVKYLQRVGAVWIKATQVTTGKERNDDPVWALQLIKVYIWSTHRPGLHISTRAPNNYEWNLAVEGKTFSLTSHW